MSGECNDKVQVGGQQGDGGREKGFMNEQIGNYREAQEGATGDIWESLW
jgi:hypothetical protein